MEKIRKVVLKLNYLSNAEFIRNAIREKIQREITDAN